MIRSLIFTLILANLFISGANAQNRVSVKGTIKTSDGKPAEYVSIGLKNTKKITATDTEGNYQLMGVKPGQYILVVSMVGSSNQEKTINVEAGKTTDVSFSISETASQLNEVAINGYRSPNNKPVKLSKMAIAPRDLPQSVQIIGKEIIADQQVNSLGDVMKNVNGVALGANRGSVGERFYARGYSLGSDNILKNGARTSIGGSPEASTLESVEVLKGSAALLYGGVTGGAVVNMVTKKPKFEDGGEVSMRTGSYDQYKPMVDIYGPISKKVAFRAISTYENSGSFRDFVQSNRFYVNPSLLYNVNDKTEILVQGDYLKSDYTPDFGVGSVDSKIVDYGRDKFINTPWAYNKTNTATAQANLNHKFNEQWQVNVLGAFQSYNRNYYGAERIRANASGIAERNLSRQITQEYTYNQQVNLSGNFSAGGFKHTLLVGLDADQSRITSNAFGYGLDSNGKTLTTINYGNVDLFNPSTYYGNGAVPDSYIVSRTFAPVYRYGTFVQDLIEVTEKFKVLAGLRYTVQKIAGSRVLTLKNDSLNINSNKFDDAFSPKLGLIYQPTKSTSLYISYANNFVPNSGLDVNNNALSPSFIDQYEAGLKNEFFKGKLTANLTYYKIINSNIAQAAILADGTSSLIYKQLNGESTSDGLEVDVTGNLVKGLDFLMGYAYNYIRYTNTADVTGMVEDVRLVGTTKNTANATLFYTFQSGAVKGLKLGTSAFYTGARNAGWNDPKNKPGRIIPLTAFTTFDFSAGYAWKKFSILAKVSNISNELNYFVHENYSVNPIAPRQFLTTLSYKF
ncbi:TonB-dependent siderophore receptor [Pedobacter changchengzhani]|uniref:TonB-dependent siderophore receptor n=1 Tax=Pedobacter changchengzhani TaxID=2529274 RepID=A0A4R5MMF7_9SPHI|nr:TonB-dependent receptor [Pedobacter changchengzhani]TDG36987.1 TonB-dependent siderophore receptor [Pedobacter changchengzhani]